MESMNKTSTATATLEKPSKSNEAVQGLIKETLGDANTVKNSQEVAQLLSIDGKIESLEPSNLMKFFQLVNKLKGIALGFGMATVGGIELGKVITQSPDITESGVKMAATFAVAFIGLIVGTVSAEKAFSK